jgi:hypothetical protein
MYLEDFPLAKLTKEGITVEWEYIGEGWCGDYTGEDDDDQLLRFTIHRETDGTFNQIEDASYCTRVPAGTSEEILLKLAQVIMDRTLTDILTGRSVKRVCEELSWLEPSDVMKEN